MSKPIHDPVTRYGNPFLETLPLIEFHPFQSLPRPEGKARRFKDLRKH